MDKKESNLILIIDFGSQYTQLIARRVRESGVYSLVKSNQITEKEFRNLSPMGIILSGGPNSVNSKTKYKLSDFIFNSGVPILGICYGMQLIADFFGGKVMPSAKKEFGNAAFRIISKTNLFKNIRVIKNYYNSKKRTSEETMFDNIIPIKSTNRQMSKRQKFTHQSSISDNCGRSQCEMRFNGCSHI